MTRLMLPEDMERYKVMLSELLELEEGLSNWEVDFLESLSLWKGDFTFPQADKLEKIWTKLLGNKNTSN